MTCTFDAYRQTPFMSYRDFNGGSDAFEYCRSLMHFVEAEKFRGVDEQYRRFILSIENTDDFILETAGVSQGCYRHDWLQVRERLLYAGVWMQVVQNKDTLLHQLLDGQLTSDLKPIDDALIAMRERILDSANDPLRQVLVAGCTDFQDDAVIFKMLDSIFVHRMPDELLIRCEAGVSQSVARYAHDHYIPLRVICQHGNDIEEVIKYASHAFIATTNDSAQGFAARSYEALVGAGKIAHHLKLEDLCAAA